MTKDEKIQFVYDSLVGEKSIPVELRMRKGFDRKKYERLVATLEDLIQDFKDSDNVPKKLALSLVDIQTSFESGAGFYAEKQSEEIHDAADDLVDLAYELLS